MLFGRCDEFENARCVSKVSLILAALDVMFDYLVKNSVLFSSSELEFA